MILLPREEAKLALHQVGYLLYLWSLSAAHPQIDILSSRHRQARWHRKDWQEARD